MLASGKDTRVRSIYTLLAGGADATATDSSFGYNFVHHTIAADGESTIAFLAALMLGSNYPDVRFAQESTASIYGTVVQTMFDPNYKVTGINNIMSREVGLKLTELAQLNLITQFGDIRSAVLRLITTRSEVDGITPLMLAAMNPNLSILDLLATMLACVTVDLQDLNMFKDNNTMSTVQYIVRAFGARSLTGLTAFDFCTNTDGFRVLSTVLETALRMLDHNNSNIDDHVTEMGDLLQNIIVAASRAKTIEQREANLTIAQNLVLLVDEIATDGSDSDTIYALYEAIALSRNAVGAQTIYTRLFDVAIDLNPSNPTNAYREILDCWFNIIGQETLAYINYRCGVKLTETQKLSPYETMDPAKGQQTDVRYLQSNVIPLPTTTVLDAGVKDIQTFAERIGIDLRDENVLKSMLHNILITNMTGALLSFIQLASGSISHLFTEDMLLDCVRERCTGTLEEACLIFLRENVKNPLIGSETEVINAYTDSIYPPKAVHIDVVWHYLLSASEDADMKFTFGRMVLDHASKFDDDYVTPQLGAMDPDNVTFTYVDLDAFFGKCIKTSKSLERTTDIFVRLAMHHDLAGLKDNPSETFDAVLGMDSDTIRISTMLALSGVIPTAATFTSRIEMLSIQACALVGGNIAGMAVGPLRRSYYLHLSDRLQAHMKSAAQSNKQGLISMKAANFIVAGAPLDKLTAYAEKIGYAKLSEAQQDIIKIAITNGKKQKLTWRASENYNKLVRGPLASTASQHPLEVYFKHLDHLISICPLHVSTDEVNENEDEDDDEFVDESEA